MDMRNGKQSNILSFNGFRYFFSLLIFLNHCTFLRENRRGKIIFEKYFHNGGFSVAFFFLLSGYCLALGYSDSFMTLTYEKYQVFLAKRLRKIFPAYFASMLIALLYQLTKGIIFDGNTLKSVIKFFGSLLWSCTMTQSWVYTKYWGIGNSAAWYISCLFFCYLLTPLIMHLIDRANKAIRAHALIVSFLSGTMAACYIFIIFLSYIWLHKGYDDQILYVTPLIRVPQFVIGLAAGYLFQCLKRECNQRWVPKDTIIEIAAITILAASFFMVLRKGFQFDRRTDIVAIPASILTIFAFSINHGLISKLLENRFSVYLGRLSLYIYLFHYVIIYCGGSQILLRLFGASNLALAIDCLILLSITMMLSALFMKYEDTIWRAVRKTAICVKKQKKTCG